MVLDYRERRAVAPNRPKKQPVSALILLFGLAIVAAYGLGVATGWLLFGFTPKAVTLTKPAGVQSPAAGAGADGAARTPAGEVPAKQTPAPSLTFYETLPKGEKAVMGSGLNPVAPPQPPKPATTALPDPAPPATPGIGTAGGAGQSPQASSAPPAAKVAPPSQAAGREKRGTFTVQIASTKDKADAETIRSRMGSRSREAYIIASQLADKGVWYRVRVGRKLTEPQARELASRIGGGAVVVPE